MGIVYAAVDVRLGREVALKLLPSRVVSDPGERRRLQNEARAASAVSHPNIAVVYDIGESRDGDVFIAMERVRGRTLRSLSSNGALSSKTALSIVRQIAAGIGAAHERGVVHRDLKPENVMVGDSGTVKVLDFGLAVLPDTTAAEGLEAPGEESADTHLIGTPAYMSPEQARGEIATPASDVFSLGSVLFEMLSGLRPFAGDTVTQVLEKVCAQAPPRLGNVSRGLERLVLRCLSKDPAGRPRDGNALLGEIDALSRRQRRARILLLGALALGTLVVIAGLVAAPSRAPKPPSVAVVSPPEPSGGGTLPPHTPETRPGVGSTSSPVSPSASPPSLPVRSHAVSARSTAASSRAIDPLARQK